MSNVRHDCQRRVWRMMIDIIIRRMFRRIPYIAPFAVYNAVYRSMYMCRITACNAWVSWNGDLAVMHAHQPLGPPHQRNAGHACEHCAQRLYIYCCLAQRGIYWFPLVRHIHVYRC